MMDMRILFAGSPILTEMYIISEREDGAYKEGYTDALIDIGVIGDDDDGN